MTGALAVLCCLAMASTAAAQAINVLYSFGSVISTNLLYPNAALIADSAGNFYSIASSGGNSLEGGLFELSPPAVLGGPWTYSPIYEFAAQSGGYQPIGDPVMDANGAIYGVTQYGGESTSGGYGVVYQLAPPAVSGGAWTENVLYTFTNGNDGGYPKAGLVFDKKGNLYGTTSMAGSLSGGVVFELSPPAVSGGTWSYNVLFSFDATKKSPGGCQPEAGLLTTFNGGLYGSTNGCGTNGGGVAFLLTPPASGEGAWTETVLHTFGFVTGKGDGAQPFEKMVAGPNGVLFGVTAVGGTSGYGTVYELVPPATKGNAWTESILYSFATTSGGIYPSSGVSLTASGVLYGALGGQITGGAGAIYKLAPPAVSGDPWTETALEVFTSNAGPGPGEPQGGLLLRKGALYGTSYFGGANGSGTVYKLIP
jgi:uncharacterized repeat protein (TIGR03803 family)